MNRTSIISAYCLYENRLFDAIPEKVRGTSRWRHSCGSILQYAGYSLSRTTLVVVALLLLLSTAFAQPVQPWRPLTFPGASTISAVLEVAGKLYVGTNSGVFVSNDKGQTWKSITSGFKDVDVRYLVGNEQTILAATYDDRVFRLAPDGQSWGPAFVGLPNGNVLRDVNGELNGLVMVGNVAFVSFDIDTLYNGYEKSVYRSVDRGVNWTRVSIPLGPAISPMCSHEGIFYCFYYKLATPADPRVGRGFLRTADGGQTWTAVPIDTPNFYTSFENRIAANADWLVMGGSGPANSIWRVPTATLSGLEHVLLPVSWWRAAEIVEKDGNFIGRGAGYVFSSTTDGQSWFPAGMFQHNVSSLAATSEGVIAGTNQGFLYASANPFADAAAGSAASYERWGSPESITAFFGSDLAESMEYCATNPLPTTLGDTEIRIRDFLGGEHSAGLFFVSPNQINAELPGGLALGEATFTINPFRGSSKSGYLRVEQVSPGIFTANGDANGVPAAYILQVSPQGAQKYIPVFRFDSVQKKYVTNPVRLFPNNG